MNYKQIDKPMNTWEVGGGSFLCASEEDAKKCMKFIEELKIEHEVELQRQRESIVDEIKGMRVKSFGRDSQFKCLSANAIYNQAIDDVLQLLKGEK